MQLGSNLLEICKEQKISMSKLARMSGVPVQTLHGWTTGKSVQNLEQLRKVADVLRVPLFELIFGQPDPHIKMDDLILKELFTGDVRVSIHKIYRK